MFMAFILPTALITFYTRLTALAQLKESAATDLTINLKIKNQHPQNQDPSQ
jgi:hypothetical protein